MFSRGEKKDDKPAARSAGSPGPGGAAGAGGGFGSRPGGPGTAPASGGFAGGKPATPASGGKGGAKKAASGGLGARLRGLMPFGQRQPSRNAKAAREGRTIEVRPISLGTDKALEIIGISLVLAGVVMLLSSLSPDPGSLIEQVNREVSRLFGWGGVIVAALLVPLGVWMVSLKVGQETPSVDLTRVLGFALLFLCVLVAMQFFDALSYPPGADQSYAQYVAALRNVLLPLSAEFGRGGGRIGGELYYQLVSNFSELAGFVILLGVMSIALMLTFSVSAQEVIAIVIGNTRNMRDAFQRRRQQVAIARAERAAALAASVQVSKPAAEGLPAPAASASPALPAGSPAQPALDLGRLDESRSIPIMVGGRTFTAALGSEAEQPVVVGASAAKAPPPVPAPPASAPAKAPPAASEEGRTGGLLGRVRGAIPTIGAATAGAAAAAARMTADALTVDVPDAKSAGAPAAESPSRLGGLAGRLINRGDKPAAAPGSAPAPTAEAESASKPPGTPGETPSRFGGLAAKLSPAQARTDDKPAAVAPSPTPATMPASAASATAPASAPPARETDSVEGEAPSRFGGLAAKLTPAPDTLDDKPAAAAPASPPIRPPAPDAEGAPLPRIGDLARSTGPTPPAAPAASTQQPGPRPAGPQPFQRPPLTPPAPVKPDADASAARPAPGAPPAAAPAEEGTSPFRPAASMQPVRPAPPSARSPFRTPIDDEDEADDRERDDEDADEKDWRSLPPARPRGILGQPATGAPASRPPVPPPARDEAPIPDLQTRMQALRSLGAPPAEAEQAPTDDMPAQPKGSGIGAIGSAIGGAMVAGAALGAAAAGAAASRLTGRDEARKDEPPPAPGHVTPPLPAAQVPGAPPDAPPAPVLPRPEQRPPSSAFGRPDEGIRDRDGALASSRPVPPPAGTPRAPAPGSPFSGAVRPPTPSAPPPAAPQPAAAAEAPAGQRKGRKSWRMPEMPELLSSGIDQELDHSTLVRRAKIIEDTLLSFGAPGRVVEVRNGPVITQFGVEPDYVEGRGGKKARVKVGAIAGLDKDLQLALGAKSIRIEAPVPGKGYVGIEVPNQKPAVVKLRDVMEAAEFRKISSPLAIALGQGVDGTPVAADLASMPHLLIAGTTGSGKSVCVNTIIASLLLRNSPDRVRLIMVDPKRVELTGYNGIPHLVTPVVVELERTVAVLKWVTREMDERYRRFALAASRNIEDYNRHLPAGEPIMPYIVVIIDELADLMMMAPDETEKVITRLAALARATGIHLVIATQRPSVDVVTGLIKANFPARIAFAVAGGVDSRVILDQPGAERLLGRGDMLYMSGDAPAPVRLQGVYVSDTEISNITRFWRGQLSDEELANAAKPLISSFKLDEMVEKGERKESGRGASAFSAGGRPSTPWDRSRAGAEDDGDAGDSFDEGDSGDEDELYEQAVDLVRRNNKASVSLLQRRFRIGYTRAARLMDMLEERGVVGPPVEGAKPREVLPVDRSRPP